MPLKLRLNNQSQTCKDQTEELSKKRKQHGHLTVAGVVWHQTFKLIHVGKPQEQSSDFIPTVQAKDSSDFKWGKSKGNEESG